MDYKRILDQRGLSALAIIGIITGGLLIGFIAIVIFVKPAKKVAEAVVTPQPSVSSTPTPTATPVATPTPTPTPTPSATPKATPTPVVSDEALIIAAVNKYKDNSAGGFTVNVISIQGSNAHGTLAYNPGGAAFLAHKTGTTWTVVSQGQSPPDAALCKLYQMSPDWCLPEQP